MIRRQCRRGVHGGGRPGGGGFPNVGGPTRDPLLPHAYHQGGCVSGAGSGKLPVVVVKQGLQMGTCVHSGCGDLHFATNDIRLAPRLANVRSKHGWFDEREACTKILWRRWRHGPDTTISQNPGGGGGGWGVSHTRTGPGRPPPPCSPCCALGQAQMWPPRPLALQRRAPQGGDSSRGVAALTAPWRTTWPCGWGAATASGAP